MKNKKELLRIKNKLEGKQEPEFDVSEQLAKFQKHFENIYQNQFKTIIDQLKTERETYRQEIEKLDKKLAKRIDDEINLLNSNFYSTTQDLKSKLRFSVAETENKLTQYVNFKSKYNDENNSKNFEATDTKLKALAKELESKSSSIVSSLESKSKDYISLITKLGELEKTNIDQSTGIIGLKNSFQELLDKVEELSKKKQEVFEFGANFILGVNGASKGYIQGIDFEAGTGITLTPDLSTTPFAKITISASGFSPQNPTSGTVDGINQVFTFASAPSLICVDQGRFMQKTSSDGTVNWTGTTTITLSIAPTFDIFAL